MTTSYNAAVGEIFRLHNEAKSWTTGVINISVATSFTDGQMQTINLSDTIGHNKNVPRPGKRSDSTCYWLQPSLDQNTEEFRRDNIHPIFAQACFRAGFLIHAEYEKNDNCIQFQCSMSKYHDELKQREYRAKRPRIVKYPDAPPEPRDRRTGRPLKGHDDNVPCPFRFRVYWDVHLSRWFLPRQQRGSLSHCGHVHEQPDLLRIFSRLGPKDEIQVAEDALDSYVPTAAAGSLYKKRTGMHLEYYQLHYLKTRKNNDLVMDAHESTDQTKITAVDRLLAELEKEPKTSYVCLYGEYDSGLLTIKTKQKTMNNSVEIDSFDTDLGDDTDNPQSFADDYRKSKAALMDTSRGKIVLAIAWTNAEARRKFDMFPEFLGGDDTEETNSEDRPLYTLCGKDNMNKSFGHTWCFMPSKSQWVYRWIFENALPILHPGTALKRVEQFSTDADPQETRAAESVCGRSCDLYKIMPNAHHRHCAWHKVNRNFTEHSKYKSKLSSTRKRSWKSSIEVDVIVRWLWYYLKYYETPSEVELATRLLHYYLNEDQGGHHGEIGEDVRKEIREFMTKSFHCNANKLFESGFRGVMSLGNCTTAVNEAEHRVYKHHCQGPKPVHDLSDAAKRINAINKDKEEAKSRKVAADMRGTIGSKRKRELMDDRLTDYANQQLLDEHAESSKYCILRANELVFYVKRRYFEHCTSPEEDLNLPEKVCNALFEKIDIENAEVPLKKKAKKELNDCKEELFSNNRKALDEYKTILKRVMKHVIPRYERTRAVRIVDGPRIGEKVMTCDCRRFTRWGLACRHMYAILKRYPQIQDAKVRWLIAYSYYYGRNERVSEHLVKIRDECDFDGVCLSAEEWTRLDSNLVYGTVGNITAEYFERSLGKLHLRGPNYWQTVASKLESDLGIDAAVLGCHSCSELGGTAGKVQKSPLPCRSRRSNVPAAPIGVVQEVRCKEDYKVPSQVYGDCLDDSDDVDFGMNDCDVSSDCDSDDLKFKEKGTGELYHDFMPMYETCTKFGKGLGPEGRKIMREGLRGIRSQLLAAHGRMDARSNGLPETNHKRGHERKRKPGSPVKKRRGNRKGK